jgi:hypothetical protein
VRVNSSSIKVIVEVSAKVLVTNEVSVTVVEVDGIVTEMDSEVSITVKTIKVVSVANAPTNTVLVVDVVTSGTTVSTAWIVIVASEVSVVVVVKVDNRDSVVVEREIIVTETVDGLIPR